MISVDEICKPENKYALGAMIAGYSMLEYWLGKTGLVKPNSLLELALSPILNVFKKKEK